MRFPEHLLDEIRTRLPLSEVVGRRVTWDKRKSQPLRGDLWACCPFHQEKSPSFHVDDRKGFYHCFGCGASGDHIRFVMETEGLSFPETVERLAGEAGVPLPARDADSERRDQRRKGLAEAVELAALYFEQRFRSDVGRQAREYAKSRGLSPETLHAFRIGYAPGDRDALTRHLLASGVDEATIVEAGLAGRPEDGRAVYDRFRNRLMIPIHDARGRVVAFGGRALAAGQEPKYLNSPETPLFSKRALLFNAHRAREAAHASGSVIIVEGYLDAIAVAQAGIRGVVATLGTAFTEEQIRALWRLAPEPVICFDGDKAGIAAAHRVIDRILPLVEAGRSFNFAFLPEGKDPDDLITEGGADKFQTVIGRARPLVEVLFDREANSSAVNTPERRAALEKKFDDLVSTIKDSRVSRRYKYSFRWRLADLFWKSDRESAPNRSSKARHDLVLGSGSQEMPSALPSLFTEKMLLGLSVAYPDLFSDNHEEIMKFDFGSDELNTFVEKLYWVMVETEVRSVDEVYSMLTDGFYEILDDVYGASDIRESRGSNLRRRIPILARHPPEDYVVDLFIWVIFELSLKREEAEFSQFCLEMGKESLISDNEAPFLYENIIERKSRIERMRKEIEDFSRHLGERNKVILKSRGRVPPPPQASLAPQIHHH